MKNKEFTDESIMPFGKYKGEEMINVPADYLLYIYEQKKNIKNTSGNQKLVMDYIEDNMDVLELEMKKKV